MYVSKPLLFWFGMMWNDSPQDIWASCKEDRYLSEFPCLGFQKLLFISGGLQAYTQPVPFPTLPCQSPHCFAVHLGLRFCSVMVQLPVRARISRGNCGLRMSFYIVRMGDPHSSLSTSLPMRTPVYRVWVRTNQFCELSQLLTANNKMCRQQANIIIPLERGLNGKRATKLLVCRYGQTATTGLSSVHVYPQQWAKKQTVFLFSTRRA